MRVHDSQAYRKMDVTRERISRILELREMFLSFQTGFSLVNVAVVCAILESIAGLKPSLGFLHLHLHLSHNRVVGAPQMTSQPVSSIFVCSSLLSGTWRTQGLSVPWCCLPTSFSVCLVFFPLSLFHARWYWPGLMNERHVHTIPFCVSLRWPGGLRVVRLRTGSWHRLPC